MNESIAQQDNVKEMELIGLNITVYKNRGSGRKGEILRELSHPILVIPGWIELWAIPGHEELTIRIGVSQSVESPA